MFVNPFSKDADWVKDNKSYFRLLDDFGVGLAVINQKMEIIALNKVMRRWFPNIDVGKAPICYKSFNNPPRNTVCSYCPTVKALADGKAHEVVTDTPSGNKIINYKIVASPVFDEKGNIVAAVEIVEDVTEHKRADDERQKAEAKYRALVENLPAVTYIAALNREGRTLYVSPQIKDILGFTPEDYYKSSMEIRVKQLYPEDRQRVMSELEKCHKSLSPFSSEYRMLTRDGRVIWVRDEARVVKDNLGRPLFLQGVMFDVSHRKNMEQVLKKSEETFRKLFEGAIDAMFIADIETGRIIDANKQAEKLLGRTREEILGMHQTQLHPQDEVERYKEVFRRDATGKSSAEAMELEVVNKNGERIPVLINASVIEIDGKKVLQGIFRDISEFKRLEMEKKEAEALALIDPHTQLYNYRYFQRRVHSEFELARRRATPLSILMIDIDYFKSINDTFGHEFGDIVLQEFAILLQHACRGIDVVTRFEGEDFAVILPDTDGKGALAFSERIQRVIKKHRFGVHKAKLRVSIGVSSYPEDGIATVDSLITTVEKCVRLAKEQGGNTIAAGSQLRKKKTSVIPTDQYSQERVIAITKKFMELIRRNKQNTIESVYALAHTVGAKNAYTEEHSEDMVKYSTEIGRKLGLADDELEDIKHGAMLHDIGKLGISEEILLKRGKLTKKEFEIIKKHPEIGADIIRPVHFLKDVVPIIFHHHERYDGYGYGSKLKGDEIPIGARIVAVVDVYQALISNRPYRKAYSKREAIKIIKEESGSHFDPKIVKVFLDVLAKEKGSKKRRAA